MNKANQDKLNVIMLSHLLISVNLVDTLSSVDLVNDNTIDISMDTRVLSNAEGAGNSLYMF